MREDVTTGHVEGRRATREDLSRRAWLGADSNRRGSPHGDARRGRSRGVLHTANSAIIAEGWRRLIDDAARFDGVTTIDVDEHVWRHTRLGDKYVIVIIDLTPARQKTSPVRLLGMVEGRSKTIFEQWLASRPKQWHIERPDRGDQRAARAPPRLRAWPPEPHQLRRKEAARRRRVQTRTTPSFAMSPESQSTACEIAREKVMQRVADSPTVKY